MKRIIGLLVLVVVAAVFVIGGCGGGDGGDAGFSQADITGTWDVIGISTGNGAGWFRATGVFDSAGNITAASNFLDSNGNTDAGAPTFKWTIDSNGEVSETDSNVNTGAHGRMSSKKNLIIWVVTEDNTILPNTVQMTIARKRTGTVFDNTNLESIPFAFHTLTTGSATNWEYGAGNTNASRQLTFTFNTLPPGFSGGLPPPNFDTISVSPAGIVTLTNDTSFYGLMTDDKKVIFSIMDGQTVGSYMLAVFMVTGPTFIQADLAGTYNSSTIRNSQLANWSYGSFSVDTSGNATYTKYLDSFGATTSPNFSRNLLSDGEITSTADLTYHGQLAYNKDLFVRTNTTAGGFSIGFGYK